MSQDKEVIAFLLELVRELRDQNKAMSGELIMRSSVVNVESPKFVKDGLDEKTWPSERGREQLELERLERLRAARTGLDQIVRDSENLKKGHGRATPSQDVSESLAEHLKKSRQDFREKAYLNSEEGKME